MKKILYHGSEKIIMKPEVGYRNSANDYGSGFYTTENQALAGEWACRKNRDGFINRYEFDMTELNICNLNSEKYHILHWLALLTRYRGYWQRQSLSAEAKDYLQAHYFIDLSDVDVVIGYRADDSYFSFASDFVAGSISLQKLSEAMRLGKLGEQIVLKSPKAFSRISYLDSQVAYAHQYYQMKTDRDLAARRAYAATKQTNLLDEIYMIDIMRGKVSDDDLRL